MFSTVLNFYYDVDLLLSLEEEISTTIPEDKKYVMHRADTPDMTQDILMVKDLNCADKINLAVSPIEVLPEHSAGFENVNPNQIVQLHEDFLTGWRNPFTRKCNVLFNLNDFPVYITHEDSSHNKYINPQQIMILDVTKKHGCDHSNVNELTKLFSLNLRKSYADTITYLQSL